MLSVDARLDHGGDKTDSSRRPKYQDAWKPEEGILAVCVDLNVQSVAQGHFRTTELGGKSQG